MGDASTGISKPDSPYITDLRVEKIAMDSGRIQIRIDVDEAFYYEMLSEMTGSQIDGEYSLIAELKELSKLKNEYESVRDAFTSVKMKGYGVVLSLIHIYWNLCLIRTCIWKA